MQALSADKEKLMTLTTCNGPVIIAQSSRDGRFGSKVVQIGPKWDKNWNFSYQIYFSDLT